MSEIYRNTPYRDSMANRLFSGVGPLLQSYLQNKRDDKEQERQYADQRKVLALRNPNQSPEDLDKFSRVNASLFDRVLNTMDTTKAQESSRTLGKEVGVEGEVLDKLNRDDRNVLIQQELQKKGEKRRFDKQQEAAIETERRQENRFIKREVKKQQVAQLESQGFSPRQALKYAGQTVEGKIPKGFTPELASLFSARSQFALGKIDMSDIAQLGPVKAALISGASGKEKEIMTLIQTQALQRVGKYKDFSKMSPIDKEYRILKAAKEMAAPFGMNIQAPRKPTAADKRISLFQANQLKREREKREEQQRLKWNRVTRDSLQDWG